MSEFAVIGLGGFGSSLARSLARMRRSVLVLDREAAKVSALADVVDMAAEGDSTDEAVLDELRIHRISTVIVAIGAENREASILTTALLRHRDVSLIVARSVDDLHRRILVAVGAHEIVNPEAEMGLRLAKRLAQPNVVDRLDLGPNAELAEIEAPEVCVGHSLMELDMRNRYHVSVVAIRRENEVLANPRATEEILSGDMLLVVGTSTDIKRLAALA